MRNVSRAWFEDKAEARAPGVLDALFPFTEPYVSPVPSVFLAHTKPRALNAEKLWVARDGELPLSWFFERHPDPGNFRGKVLIQERLSKQVPRSWKNRTGTYRVVSLAPRTAPKALLVAGLPLTMFNSFGQVESELHRVVSVLGASRVRALRKIALSSPFVANVSGGFESRYRALLRRALGRIEVIEWHQLVMVDTLSDFGVIELHGGAVCADSTVAHFALSRGARLVRPGSAIRSLKQLRKDERYVAFSPFHGIVVQP